MALAIWNDAKRLHLSAHVDAIDHACKKSPLRIHTPTSRTVSTNNDDLMLFCNKQTQHEAFMTRQLPDGTIEQCVCTATGFEWVNNDDLEFIIPDYNEPGCVMLFITCVALFLGNLRRHYGV